MDGVLADFAGGVRELCNMEPTPLNGKRDVKYDDLMWEKIKGVDHFYAKLEPIPGAKGLFDAVFAKHGPRCEILTAIPKPNRGILYAEKDKIEWVHRYLSNDIRINIVMREDKPNFCAGKDCVLIDDLQKNVKSWRELGGTGIVFIDTKTRLTVGKDKSVLEGNFCYGHCLKALTYGSMSAFLGFDR